MDIKKPQLVKVGAFAYFFEGVLQHPQGMCVHNARVSDTNKVTVSMSSLLPGVYVAAIVSDNGVFTSKIAKK